jgi:hypothetical protein
MDFRDRNEYSEGIENDAQTAAFTLSMIGCQTFETGFVGHGLGCLARAHAKASCAGHRSEPPYSEFRLERVPPENDAQMGSVAG